MGKHKSRKRRLSPSSDRLAGLEDKLQRLIDVLAQREVRTPRRPSLASSSSSSMDRHEPQEAQPEVISDTVGIPESISMQTDLIESEFSLAAPARQEGPTVQRDSGMYDLPGSIFAEYRRQVDTAFPNARNNLVGFSRFDG